MPEIVLPDLETWERTWVPGDIGGPRMVILYNCDCHSFDEVILQLVRATGCHQAKAEQIAEEAHHLGRAVAFSGDEEECERVAAVLASIGLQVETDRV
jgi:ATP-dependent Clp protease adaptor protein ClpS